MKKIISSFMVIMLLSGCAARRFPVTYHFDKDIYMSDVRVGRNVLIDIFDDQRPVGEREGTAEVPGMALYLKDEQFKPDIAIQVSELLAKHLEESGLFENVRVKDVSDSLEANLDQLNSLKAEGADLVITGTLKHFYGYLSGNAGPAVALGIVFVFAEAFVNPKDTGGKAEYENLKIFDTAKKEILWQGNIDHEHQVKETFYRGPMYHALWALREVNNELTQKLEEVLKP